MSIRGGPKLTFAGGLLQGAIITAGGKARRFGRDKVLAVYEGRTLLERVAASLPPAPTRLILSGNAAHTLPHWRTLPDARAGSLGPLSGLETGLSTLPAALPAAGWVAFCAADMPNLSAAYWQILLGQVTDEAQVVVVRDEAGRLQPLAALYHTDILPVVTEQLDAGKLSMNALLERLNCRVLPLEEAGTLFNVNTPEDWLALKQKHLSDV